MNGAKFVTNVEASLTSSKYEVKALWIISITVLTAISAQIEIPVNPVPFTFQTFMVLLGIGLLGKNKSSLAQILYLSAGASGLPVFAGASFGISKLIGPTGGYLFGYVISSYLAGWMLELKSNKSFVWIFSSLLFASIIIFASGVIQLNFVYTHEWTKSLQIGFIQFALWDLLKVIIASMITYRISRLHN